jgi:hypothetical protein
VFDPALPGRSSIASGSTGSFAAVVDERAQRVKPEASAAASGRRRAARLRPNAEFPRMQQG